MESALPARLVRDIDIHRDHRGHCAYNEKLGRVKVEYIKIGLERAEQLHLARFGTPLGDSDLVIVTRPDVDLNQRQGKLVTKGLDQMAALLQKDPNAVGAIAYLPNAHSLPWGSTLGDIRLGFRI